jgi:uncharacterized membrane protein YcaP (DUF421 family)
MLFKDWYGIVRVIVSALLGYTALIVVLRASGKRTLSKMNAFDLVVTMSLGSTLATLVLSRDVAVAEGAVAFCVLAGLQYAVSWASARSTNIRLAVKADPTLVFYRGEFQQSALIQARLVESEVRAAVRQRGIASLEDVEAVILETAGDLSVISKPGGGSRSALVDIDVPSDR